MRLQTFLMTFGSASVFASIGYFMLSGQSPKDAWTWMNRYGESKAVAAAPEAVPNVPVAAKPEPTRVLKPRLVIQQTPIPAPEEPKPVIAAVVEPAVAAKPTLTTATNVVGLTKKQLLDQYAAPSLHTNGLKDGDMFEELYYTNRASGNRLIVNVKNGTVTGMRSQPL